MSVRTGQAGTRKEAALCAAPQSGEPPSAAAHLCGLFAGGGISALRLVRSVHSCAVLAKNVFFLKTKVLCPTAASGVFSGPKNLPGSEKIKHLSAKCKVPPKRTIYGVFLKVSSPETVIYTEVPRDGIAFCPGGAIQHRQDPADKSVWGKRRGCHNSAKRCDAGT